MKDRLLPLTRRDMIKLLATLPLGLAAGRFLPYRGESLVSRETSYSNILILVLDALSASHMSLYGYPRETTPNIDSFAKRCLVYHRHYATGNFTTPGTASFLTGTYPWLHRGLHLNGTILRNYATRSIFSLLPTSYYRLVYTHNSLVSLLLAQFFQNIDRLLPFEKFGLLDDTFARRWSPDKYKIAYWSEHLVRGFDQIPSSLFGGIFESNRTSTLEKRLNEYQASFPRGIPYTNGQRWYFILEDVVDWLINNLSNLAFPFLGYFHLFPPHEPYHPRREFIDRFDDGWQIATKPEHYFTHHVPKDDLIKHRRYYDEYLAYADAEFGRLIKGLEKSGVLDNTILILTSDHGQLFERGIHGHMTPVMYEPLVHIPLLIACPGQKQREDVHSLTSAADLMPSLLHYLGEPIPTSCEGQLLPGLGGRGFSDRCVFALDAKESSKWGLLEKGTAAVWQGHYKMIHYFGYNGYDNIDELYKLDDDSDELKNIARANPDLVSELKAALREKLSRANAWE